MDIIRSEHTKPLNLMEIKVSVTHGMPANYLQLWMHVFYAKLFNKPSMYIDFTWICCVLKCDIYWFFAPF